MQISTKRRACCSVSEERKFGRLSAGNAAEDRANGHAHAGNIALSQNIAGHDLSRGEEIGGGAVVLHKDARILVHFQSEIGEGDSGAQRVSEERGLVDRPGPMRLRRIDPLGAAAIEGVGIKFAGTHGLR